MYESITKIFENKIKNYWTVTIISATIRLQVSLLRCFLACWLHRILGQQPFANRLWGSRVWVTWGLVKNKDSGGESRGRPSDFLTRWQSAQHVLLPPYLLSADSRGRLRVTFVNPRQTDFPSERLFFSNSCVAQSSLALAFGREKKKTKRVLTFFFRSVLSFIFWKLAAVRVIFYVLKNMCLWPGVCTEKKSKSKTVNSQFRQNILDIFRIYLKKVPKRTTSKLQTQKHIFVLLLWNPYWLSELCEVQRFSESYLKSNFMHLHWLTLADFIVKEQVKVPPGLSGWVGHWTFKTLFTLLTLPTWISSHQWERSAMWKTDSSVCGKTAPLITLRYSGSDVPLCRVSWGFLGSGLCVVSTSRPSLVF